jgi:hypothetical protein
LYRVFYHDYLDDECCILGVKYVLSGIARNEEMPLSAEVKEIFSDVSKIEKKAKRYCNELMGRRRYE